MNLIQKVVYSSKKVGKRRNIYLQNEKNNSQLTALNGFQGQDVGSLILTEVIRAGSSFGDINKRCTSWDVQDFVVTKGDGDILEASPHLSAGGVPPATNPTSVNHGAGVQNPVTALGLPGRGVSDSRVNGGREKTVRISANS